MDKPIDFQKTYESTKKRINLEHKKIKSMSIYNFLNDSSPNLIIDSRENLEENAKMENGKYILNSFLLYNFPFTTITIKPESRLILIMDEKQNLQTDNEFEKLRTYIVEENNIKEIYITTDYKTFIVKFPFLLINEKSSEEETKKKARLIT